MGLACYLAMTAAEFQAVRTLPTAVAWMSCHFSGHSRGLSNLPEALPEGSVLILDDSIPIAGHDPVLIRKQLEGLAEQFPLKGILLDFERPGVAELAALAGFLTEKPCCPVCVSRLYAKDLSCPVFLPPPPLHSPLKEYLAPWKGRSVWLELAAQCQIARIDSRGCRLESAPMEALPPPSFLDRSCCSRYHWALQNEEAVFTMVRDLPELAMLEADARALGVAQTIGLYQQLGKTTS